MPEQTIKRISIETTNRELIYELWDAKTDGVSIQEQLSKAEGSTHLDIYIDAVSHIVAATLPVFIKIILKHLKNSHKKTKAKVYTKKQEKALRELVKKLSSEIEIQDIGNGIDD